MARRDSDSAAAAIGTIVVTTLPASPAGDGGPADNAPAAGQLAPPNVFKYFVVFDNSIATPVQIEERLGCLEALDVTRDSVEVIADGDVDGQAATLVVTRDLGAEPADADLVRTIVVAAGCSADGAEILQERTTER
jgi:hypothetical protein